jgi:hypothetical protein
LDLLRGPLSGTVRLPSYLDWSGNAVYDLDTPGRVVDLCRAWEQRFPVLAEISRIAAATT